MRLFEEDGITMLSEIIPDNFGDTSHLSWKATYDGIAFIELSHLDGSVAGNAAAYQVSYQETSSGPIFYFPLIYK